MSVRNIAVVACAARGQAPQHGAVVNVQHTRYAMFFGISQSRLGSAPCGGRGQMGAGNGQRTALSDKGLTDLARIYGHVGTVFAHEQQRKGVAVFQAEQDQRGETFRVDLHLADVATFALQRFRQKAPHLLVAHTRNHGATQAQACHAKREVGRAATEVLGHAAGVLQPAAELLGIQVNRQTPQAGQINRTTDRKFQCAHDRNREYVEM